jgi:hypothetical protein
MSAVVKALAVSAFSRAMIFFRGARGRRHAVTTSRPHSLAHRTRQSWGSPGSAGERCAVVTPRARNFAARMC